MKDSPDFKSNKITLSSDEFNPNTVIISVSDDSSSDLVIMSDGIGFNYNEFDVYINVDMENNTNYALQNLRSVKDNNSLTVYGIGGMYTLGRTFKSIDDVIIELSGTPIFFESKKSFMDWMEWDIEEIPEDAYYSKIISIECESAESAASLGNKFFERLAGIEDYVDSAIILNVEDKSVTLSIGKDSKTDVTLIVNNCLGFDDAYKILVKVENNLPSNNDARCAQNVDIDGEDKSIFANNFNKCFARFCLESVEDIDIIPFPNPDGCFSYPEKENF